MVGSEVELPSRSQVLTVSTPDGETLRGVRLPASGDGDKRPVILGFGGNGWNAAEAANYLRGLFPDRDVVTFHYRGYRPSTGRAGAAALTADSLLVYDDVARRFPGRPVVAVGFSVGTGVAAFLASRRDLAGLILVTPFDSLEAVAAGQYPWVPVRLLFRHPMPSADWLKGRDVPVALIAGGADTLVVPARTEALRRRVPNLVYDRTIADAGHNDIYRRPDFEEAMRRALERIERR
jgi:pimeloyl-ACP methyl ester carboxylesterase